MVRPAERYRLLELLGAGSIGEVHRALDRATNREVALKLMPRPRGGTNLRDEFVALARLRHPNVVSVLDYGLTDSGHEYFTMELVRGPPLAEATGAPGGRAFYELLAGVLDALAAVHAAGLVHADIKPSNVLVDGPSLIVAPDRAARLGDFGLATPLLDPIGPTARGTVGYAAPEAWTGRLDPRSDLYSFGVVLWQLVSGSHPFRGATPRAIVGLQRSGSPDPRRLPPGLPPALTELMTALLDPLPGARPETAAEVLDRWRAIADGLGHRGVLAGRVPSGRSPRIAIEVGTVLGRDQELGELERAWADARAGRGSPTLIIGEPGIGKSRLLAELALRIQLDGGDVIRVSARAGDEPWAGVRELVRALLASTGPAWDDRGLSPARRAAVATFLSRGGNQLGPGRWMMAETAAELVLAAAAQRPLAILVDDIDAASPAALDLLAYLARAVPDAAALLVLAGRGLEPGRAPVRSPVDAAVAAAARGRRFELAPLGQSSFFALTRAAVGAELGGRLADELRRVSGGNPGHALAALEAMLDAGTLARVGGAWVLSRDAVVPLPAAARQGVMARLAGLATASRALLRVAATLGDSFDRELLAAILAGEAADDDVEPAAYRVDPSSPGIEVTSADAGPRPGDPGTDAIDAALADGVASRVLTADPAAGQFRFAHAELADVLGRELPVTSYREYHRRAALTLDRRLATGREVPAAVMARHFRAIGDLALASSWSQTAAHEATRRGDLAGALAHASDALALATPDQRRGAVRLVAELAARHGDLELALHHFRLAGDGADPAEQIGLELEIADLERRRGDLAAALDAASAALLRAHRRGEAALAARCYLGLGRVHEQRGDHEVAGQHVTAGLDLAHRAGDRKLAAELGRLAAAIATNQGDPERAMALVAGAQADAAAGGDDSRLQAALALELGRAAIQAGDIGRAVEALERAVALAEAAGDLEQRARSLNHLGAAHYYQGNWAEARRVWEHFRQQSERQGERLETVYALNNLGSLYRDLGLLAAARSALGRAAELAASLDHARMGAMILGNLGEVDARAGDLAAARERYDRALAECQRLGAHGEALETRRRLSELDLILGRPDESLSRALEAARDARDRGSRFEEGVLHRIAGAAVRTQGDFESAAWFLARARELLTGHGARYELARISYEEAELARATGDVPLARVHLAAAEAELIALGARWDLDRVRALDRALGPAQALRLPADDGAGAIAAALVEGDLDGAVDRGLDGVLRTTGCDRGFVLVLDGQGRPQVKARRLRPGARRFERGDADVSGTIVRRVAASGQAIAVADAILDEDLREVSSVVALGLRRVFAAPLRARGRLIGIVYADSSGADLDEPPLDGPAVERAAAPLTAALDHALLLADARRNSELMSILAHEIRNPLAGILGYSDVVAEGAAGPGGLAPVPRLARIHHEAERLRRLVDNVFELARHEAGHVDWPRGPVDVGPLVRDVAEGFGRLLGERHLDLQLTIADPLAPAMGNADRLAQVIGNLLGNAIKFSPEGERIDLSVRRETVTSGDPMAPPIPASDPRAWIPTPAGDEIGEVVRIDVRDRGPGLSADLQAHLFEKFSQGAGAATRGGLGLGLYVCREIIRSHGGSIWVSSDTGAGGGATFSVRLPVAL